MQEQYTDAEEQTKLIDIYKIKIWEMTLRELLLFQSIYSSETQADVFKLIKMQPSPQIFLKISLELGLKSMIPYLSFDAHSIKYILNEKHSEHFSTEFPLFYKDKNGKSPIDVALENNLINSVNQMLDYMVIHQNSYVYAFIVEEILVEMINKGVTMKKLLNSNIIMTRFDYDEWPSLHSDTNKVIAGYNKSVFKMRYEYSNVFRPQWEEEQHKLDLEMIGEYDTKAQKVYKINYYLNILTSVN